MSYSRKQESKKGKKLVVVRACEQFWQMVEKAAQQRGRSKHFIISEAIRADVETSS